MALGGRIALTLGRARLLIFPTETRSCERVCTYFQEKVPMRRRRRQREERKRVFVARDNGTVVEHVTCQVRSFMLNSLSGSQPSARQVCRRARRVFSGSPPARAQENNNPSHVTTAPSSNISFANGPLRGSRGFSPPV